MKDPFSVAGRTIFVTGSSSGIGAGIARVLAEQGSRVILHGRDEGKLQLVMDSLTGSGHLKFCGDLTDLNVVTDIVRNLPVLDGLVLNSGTMHRLAPFSLDTIEAFEEVIRVNLTAPARLLHGLIKAKKISNKASVVFTNGTTAFVGPPASAAYSASKGGLLAFSRSVANDLARRGIRCNSVAYGYVRTEAFEKLGTTPEGPLGTADPRDAAGPVLFLLSDASRWMTRSVIVADGGLCLMHARGF